ncbi:glyoxalase III HchA [Salmonella enterica subsp. enterica serovar Braenderup]
MNKEASKLPQLDPAENNAFFPSAYSLKYYTKPISDLSDTEYFEPYTGRKKILVVASDERYLSMDNGTLFSTGNHPIETLLPMIHLNAAGFDFDIATISGLMTKFEYWAMPWQDERVITFFEKYKNKFISPLQLKKTIKAVNDEEYAAIFIPGGHGALIGLPESEELAVLLRCAMKKNMFILSICHGPAAFLSTRDGKNPLQGYSICAFPDNLDRETPNIGYMPGNLKWFFGEELEKSGIKIINRDIDGAVFKDRRVITGDSPLAANALGKLAALEMLAAFSGNN